jgi:hypothetical protein
MGQKGRSQQSAHSQKPANLQAPRNMGADMRKTVAVKLDGQKFSSLVEKNSWWRVFITRDGCHNQSHN